MTINRQGMVRWPDPADGWHDTGEGGLVVWAVVTEEDAKAPVDADTSVATLSEPDTPPLHDTGSTSRTAALWGDGPGFVGDTWMNASEMLAAAVQLDSTRHAWARDGEHFVVRGPEDLTEDGRQLVRLLEQATGGPVRLLTMLDT